ncbi:hypothetical protein [Candidatus Arsenophonus triatominarum]|uniref:hypothetical protein n=1 Tax=Candidatus Arsenophonus triatominarum TaxID=57911 RepID=UPI0007C49D60|nr:hypothetical protein [Candidatus Arsenophonus triatominarum]
MLSSLNNVSKFFNISHTRSVIEENSVNKGNSTICCSLLKKIKNVFNSFVKFVKKTSNKPNFIRQKVLDNKEVRMFIDNYLLELNILGKVKNDKEGKFQLIDSTLASIYSRQKDMFCKEEKDVKLRQDYLIEVGELCKNLGLKGKENSKGQFIPSAAGAYPYATAVMSIVQKKYPFRIFNYGQRKVLENYAMQKVYKDVAKLCKEEGIIQPNDFCSKLNDIRDKYRSKSNAFINNFKTV